MAEKAASKKDNRIAKFLRGTKSELKKIIWPTWKQIAKNTSIVIVFVIIFGLLIAGLDALFNISIIQWFTN